MHEHWTYDFEDRIFPTPIITLPIVDEAIREFESVVERGARAILIRPAPVPGFNGQRRSFALPEFDPFWKVVEESGVLVGMHASDDGFQRYINDWEGASQEFLPFKNKYTAFYELVHNDYRSIKDTVASIIGHGLATRFPRLRFMPVENGSAWVRPLIENLKKIYAVSPELFDEDPLVTLKRSIYVHPFHEENVLGLVEAVGAENVVFGSDYPHPEGMFDPVTWVDELETLPLQEPACHHGREPRQAHGRRPGRQGDQALTSIGSKRSLLAQERSRDTRKAIIKAALELWAERGYASGIDETDRGGDRGAGGSRQGDVLPALRAQGRHPARDRVGHHEGLLRGRAQGAPSRPAARRGHRRGDGAAVPAHRQGAAAGSAADPARPGQRLRARGKGRTTRTTSASIAASR